MTHPVPVSVPVSQADYAAVDSLVDWDLATRTAARLVGAGPVVDRGQVREVVQQLRDFAVDSTGYVCDTTGLQAVPGEGVLVVDRPRWAQVNVQAFRTVLAPAVAEALRRRPRAGSGVTMAVGRRVTGTEVGTLLSFLASRVLGQYDVFGEPASGSDGGRAPGRLLLVAPNIVHVERELEVDPRDFRLWVCLHEETHRVQFAAAPWLRDHLLARSRSLTTDLLGDPGALVDRLSAAVRQLPGLVRGGDRADVGILELLQTPQQRAVLAEVTAVMSLLEGHADVVMDEVGPQVIPTVATIRKRFQQRRAGQGSVDRALRRLLGLDAKMRQYRNGAVFVRGVVERVGMEGLNRVWTSPQTLPLPAEIADPAAWVRRVHG